MSSSSEEELTLTPNNTLMEKTAKNVIEHLLAVKSKQVYLTAYENFMHWRAEKQVNTFSESVLLTYFDELSKKLQPSTLWSVYSMLKSTLQIKNNDSKLLQRIKNRGPDCNHAVKKDVGNGMTATFLGSVLWMQGPRPVQQPVENESGILLYNGDIFDETWDATANDTEVIFEKLTACNGSEENIINELKLLKGPFSIIFYNTSTQVLYFMRDRIGRNSLLFYKNDDSIVISSVLGRKYKCLEVPATGIHILNLNTDEIRHYPWETSSTPTELPVAEWVDILQNHQNLSDEDFIFECENVDDVNEDEVLQYLQKTALETKCKVTLMNKLLEEITIRETVRRIIELLEKSVRLRLEAHPGKCINCINKSATCSHSSVGVLFSGGLDCTILALLSDKFVPKEQSVELLNVAFKKDNCQSYDVPDRLTGKQSFEELKKLRPARNWTFTEINVSKEEVEEYQSSTIADLVYPRQTILDESLGTALWFAARGHQSSCRVLLLGSGADELFGGYTRHRNAFKRQGWSGLNKELQLDWRRISYRNLARDNRVICDHGRQSRLPYLDEDFTNYVMKLKPWLRCFHSLEQGVGDKLMLRLVAFNLGLSEVSTFPKRALQFGSRIANKKEKGSDISIRFSEEIKK